MFTTSRLVPALLAALVLTATGTGAALAGSSTNNVTVSASVGINCSISTGTVAFGSYDPLVANNTSALNQSGTFSVSCPKGTSATIALGNGGNFSGGHRFMNSGGNQLQYELYSDSGLSHVWTSSNTVAYNSNSTAAFTETIYGQIPAGQDAATGTYSDTVVATINF